MLTRSDATAICAFISSFEEHTRLAGSAETPGGRLKCKSGDTRSAEVDV